MDKILRDKPRMRMAMLITKDTGEITNIDATS